MTTVDPAASAMPDLDDATRRGTYAGFISRAIAYFIDLGVVALLFSLVQLVVSSVASVLDLDYDPTTGEAALILSLSSYVIFLLYFTIAFSLFGRTVGKLLLGLRVVRPDGRNPNVRRSFLRAIGYSISTILCYCGFLMAAVTRNRQALHDKMAGTHVIYTWNARRAALVVPRVNQPLPPREG